MTSRIENVVFISIDSLREDYFAPGDIELTTPAISEIRNSGVHFDSVITLTLGGIVPALL